jgi:hypothetical protein
MTPILITAATDSEFRFHVLAGWSDVRAKAKRIRAQGGVQITHSDELMVIGNVQGDHHVYETGLQRMVGQRHSVAVYSCGCKWGAYHWGASDDFSKFAGRMCSHALALQYEAQSRGMFGRDVEVDDHKPRWVPNKVVVKYDIDDDRSIKARASLLVPEQPPLLAVLALAEPGDTVSQVVLAAVNELFGERAYEEPTTFAPAGPTVKPNPYENPTSAGPLSGGEPRDWGSINSPSMLSRTSAALQHEAFWQALIPLVRAIAPKVIKAVAPAAIDHAVRSKSKPAAPEGAEADLHEEPEGALPETDGDSHTAALGDGIDAPATELGSMADTDLSPDDTSMQTHGGLDSIVAAFQASEAGQSLVGSGDKGETSGGKTDDGNDDIAKAAQAFLAGSSFTAAERDELINESPGVQAGNTDRLDIEGTHYAELDKLSADQDEDALWMMV